MAKKFKEILKENGDWSLRANGKTYDDNGTVSAKLTKRLKNSSSSVIGIAGRRGVGKSSLAQRVLANRQSMNSFAVLIHSPTRYDPQEYLATLFQAVCEEVVRKVDSYFGEADSMEKRGKAELRRLTRVHRIIFLSLAILALFLIYIACVGMFDTLWSIATVRVSALSAALGQFAPIAIDLVPSNIVLFLIIIFLFILLVFSIPLIAVRYMMPIGQLIRNAKTSLPRSGLRKTALRHSEYLRFHTTFSSSSEIGLSASGISSKYGIGKSLATRPLTLPSLAKQFTQFLDEIAKVYSGGPVVICIDELDKIEKPNDLDDLLRGIKGIFGESEATHYLLTVSEDALTRFNEQRQMKRGILESAFQDIVLLDRIDLDLTDKIVNPMYRESDRKMTDGANETSTGLLWLFGNAIPREIKRNALACFEKDSPPKSSPPEEIWKLLIKARLDEMKFWATHAGGDNSITNKFLDCIEDSIRKLVDSHDNNDGNDGNDGMRYGLAWGNEFVASWKALFEKTFLTAEYQFIKQENNSEFGSAIIEILLGASALVYVVDDDNQILLDSSIENELNDIFKFLPVNLEITWGLMVKYLAKIKILEKSPNEQIDELENLNESHSGN